MIDGICNPYKGHDLRPFQLDEGRSSFINKKFPIMRSQERSEQKFPRPVLYIDQLHEKCLFPERYLSYSGECLDYEKVLKQRIVGCECFCKNNLREQAFSVASCIMQNYKQFFEKERACEKLRPLFLKYPLSLEVAHFIASSMPESSYFLLAQCHNALQEKDWEVVSRILPNLQDSWKVDFIPELMSEEKFDLLVEVVRGFSVPEKDRICDKLIEVNTLESLQAAEKIASPSYLLLIQCWIALKENRLLQARKGVVSLPESFQKEVLIKALSNAEDFIKSQNALEEPSSNPKFYKTFFAAVCIGFLACMAAFFYRRKQN